MSVIVPTVERGLLAIVFCSIEITGDNPNTKSTSGFATCDTNRFANVESDSMYRRCPSA
jgi:hypothetical protein